MSIEAGQPNGGGVVDHALLNGLVAPADDHTQYALLAGRAGGQSLFGGTAAGDDLDLAASPTPGAGRININSPVIFGPYQPTGATYAFSYTAAETFGVFIGGGLNFSGTITTSATTFIYESFRGAPTINTGANPGFAAYTVLQALPAFNSGSGAGHNPISPLILNCGPNVSHGFTGTRTVGNVAAVNLAPTIRTTASGGTLTVTNLTGMTVAPKWSTAAGSTVNFGTIRGLHCQVPTVAPFGGSSAGVELMAAYYAVQVDNLNGFGGTSPVAAVRSEISAGTNAFFLLNPGGAESSFQNGDATFNDNAGIVLGTGDDVLLTWNGIGLVYNPIIGDDLGWVFAAGSHTLQSLSSPSELRVAHERTAWGQVGAIGNQSHLFVSNAYTITVGGEWSNLLMTDAANKTIDAALGGFFGWTINAPAGVLGTGSCTAAGVLNIGGNVAVGSVDRFGVRILSNPSGGSGVNAALWVTAGRAQFDGFVDLNKPIALGGGAAATLGTIGGAGPTAAAQAQWVQIEVNGVAHWIAAWT